MDAVLRQRDEPFDLLFPKSRMMNGSDLYELAKILDHSNFKLTERYVRLAPKQIAQNQKHCAGECGPTLRG